MPFLRYTRDKRGYETTYLMHSYRPSAGPQRTRILYLFHSPAHLKVGRRPLDEEAREGLEHTHPDLSFDWAGIARESAPPYFEARDTRDRPPARPSRPNPPPRQPVVPEVAPVVIDDRSVLGRAVGGTTAARLRARYADVLQRIARRARTPEDRDRLTARAQRLNPDEWTDEATARAGAEHVDADWEGVLAELPARRRGRRGGRRRLEGTDAASAVGTSSAETQSSAIMATGDIDAEGDDPDEARIDVSAGHRGDRAPVGPATEPDSLVADAAGGSDEPGRSDVPGDG